MAIVCGFVLVAWMGWRSPNHLMPNTPVGDSGGFLTIGKHVVGGRLLYREVFDHKPPLMFLLMAALASGDDLGVDNIRYFEKCVAGLTTLLVMLIARAFTGRAVLAIFTGLLFVFTMYSPPLFGLGNVTEEYGNFLCLIAVLSSSPPIMTKRPKTALFLVGLFSCLAGLMKEPYAIICFPWMVYAVCMAAGRLGWFRSAIILAAGSVAALLPFVAYFAYHGTIADWISVYTFNLAYAAYDVGLPYPLWDKVALMGPFLFGTRYAIPLAMAAGLLAVCNRSWLRERRFFGLMVLCGFVAACYAAMGLSIRFLLAYRLMPVPMWCLLLCSTADAFLSIRVIFPDLTPRFGRWMANHWPRVAIPVILAGAVASMAWPVQSLLVGRVFTRWVAGGVGAVREGMDRVMTPTVSWRRPPTTLEKLVDGDVIASEGIMILNQQTVLYYSMHSLLAPTQPMHGISTSIPVLQPEYLDQCRQVLLDEPPGFFIGRRPMYGFAIDHVKPSLDENYHFLGLLPLYAEESLAEDVEYHRLLHWYVRKDLLPLIDGEYLARALEKSGARGDASQ